MPTQNNGANHIKPTGDAAHQVKGRGALPKAYPKTPEGLQRLEVDIKELGAEVLADNYGVTHHAVLQHRKRLRKALAITPVAKAVSVATCRVAFEPEAVEGEVLAWVGPDEEDPAFVSWRDASGAVPTQVAIELAGTPAELIAWMVPPDEDAENDVGDEAEEINGKLAALLDELAKHPLGAEPRRGYETLAREEQLKRFFDAVGIGPYEQFVLSARFECRDSKNPDQWCERWTHQTATRMGTSGDAQLSDSLRYGKHEPSGRSKGTLSSWCQKTSEDTRNWQYFLRTAVFELDSSDKKLRSFEQSNVKRRRDYFVEADGLSLTEQRRRIEQYEAGGLKFNACVFSGNKSLQLRIKRPSGWISTPEQDRWIDQALCVLFDGDTDAQTLHQAARLPGFKREGKHEQRLLWATSEVLYASYDELRETLERLLAQVGVEDLEAAHDALAAKEATAKQRRDLEARQSSELGREWDEWEAAGGWSEGERRVAATFGGLSAAQLIGLMPQRAADLVKNGSEAGCRNADGLYLTLELRGVVDKLCDLHVPRIEKTAQEVLARFVAASGGDVDEARLFDQYDRAEGAVPGRPVASFLSSLHYVTQGLLGKRKPKAPALPGNTPLGGLLGAIGPGEWVQDDEGTPIRPPKISVGQFAEMVEALGPALRWNDLTQQVEYSGEMLRPEEVELLYVDLNKQDRFVSQKTAIDVVVHRSRVHRYDPVREYLEYLESAADVEPVDLGTLATTYLGTGDPLYDRMLQVMVLGAVSRRFEPGCKFDYVVVLKGEQGIRKSTFWQALASPDWYTTSVPDDDKDLLLTVHSTWIFELAELESVTGKRSVGKLKNIITTSSDLLRIPYGKTTERRPRSSVFVSTVNGDAFLRDETGERRYYVIECPQDPAQGGYIDVEPVIRDRDRIWKAAVLAYRAGQKPYLGHALQHESDVRNEAYQVEDPWAPMLDEWLERDPTYRECDAPWNDWRPGAPEQFDTRQALLGSGVRDNTQLEKKHEMRMATLLKKRGYVNEQQSVGGRRKRLWSKPKELT